MHEKHELEAVARQEYSTDICEEYEYSHENVDCVSLPHKNARIQFIQNTTRQQIKKHRRSK